MRYGSIFVFFIFLVAGCKKTAESSQSPEIQHVLVEKTDFKPLHTFTFNYASPFQDTLSWDETDSLIRFYEGFQDEPAIENMKEGKHPGEHYDLWINFRAESTTLSFSHTFPDYSVNLRRMAFVMDRMASYLGKGYRVTTQLETIRRKIEDFEEPSDNLIVEFGLYKRNY